MNFTSTINSLSVIDIVIILLYGAFIVLEIYPTSDIASLIDTPIGYVIVILFALYMMFYFNPIIGVITLYVAYELIRRSSAVNNRLAMKAYTPTQEKKDVELNAMNPTQETTLEEELINTMAPIGKSSLITYTISEYKPVASDVHGATAL
jgi:hypothetical protein